jgi:hypothetical protein
VGWFMVCALWLGFGGRGRGREQKCIMSGLRGVGVGGGTGSVVPLGVWPERDLKHAGIMPSCHYGKS